MIVIYCSNDPYFYLIINALKYELSELLGYDVKYIQSLSDLNTSDIVICFGFQQMIQTIPNIDEFCKKYKIIIYNTEQLQTPEWTNMIHYMINAVEIWDYSMRNINILANKNIFNVRYVPFGYSTAYELINNPDDISRYNKYLTFIGTRNNRRQNILNKLSKQYPVDIYGFDNNKIVFYDNYTKLVESNGIYINIHFYIPSILEIVRLVPLICNKCCIITENSNDPVLDKTFAEYVQWINIESDYEEQLRNIMKNAKNIADESYNKFKNYKYSDILTNNGCIAKLNDLTYINTNVTNKIQVFYGNNNIYEVHY
jgi:hypothetical protein